MGKTKPGIKKSTKYPKLGRTSLDFARPGMFTPEGRLLQVEWARKCPSGGNLIVAMKTSDGLLLAKGKLPVKAELERGIPLIWHITPTVAFVATGNIGDMFHVYDMLTIEHTETFTDAARKIRAVLHEYAVSTIKRPLSLLILLGGVENGAQKIANIDILGYQRDCDAWAVGNGDAEALNLLSGSWKPSINRESGLRLIKKIYAHAQYGSSDLETCFLPKPNSK